MSPSTTTTTMAPTNSTLQLKKRNAITNSTAKSNHPLFLLWLEQQLQQYYTTNFSNKDNDDNDKKPRAKTTPATKDTFDNKTLKITLETNFNLCMMFFGQCTYEALQTINTTKRGK